MPRIPLIEELTNDPIPTGSVLLVVFDPSSQWYNAAITIAAGWLRQGGMVDYAAYMEPPERVRFKLNRLGVNAAELEVEEKLRIWDWYTATLGEKSKEKYARESLRVSDLSLLFSPREASRRAPEPGWLNISDNTSTVARFNDERNWVEYVLTRPIRMGSTLGHTMLRGVVEGVHSGWVYKQLESAHDGIIDFKLEGEGAKLNDVMRIRSMRNVHFDREWHRLKLGENFEVSIVK